MLSAILPEYFINDLKVAVANNNIDLIVKILNLNKNLVNQADEVLYDVLCLYV